eukprot:TRINITY_DN21071_c0_g1_i1.p1 TRINITY_DN21071_c0_g1~~TRINITY_DN21071_c0_g1_i1.p1  ORF type:complete len:148 (+),score=26.43 TRINITY_DN21071_c0_g1_i1:163-606(+)
MGAFSSTLHALDSVLEFHEDRRDEFLSKLDEMAKKNVKFRHVAVWRQAFLYGTVDHHTLVYEYIVRSEPKSLKVDWGRDGLHFHDSHEDPCPEGDIITRKLCRISPATVREQFLEVKDFDYDLATWNCQHFSRYMYDKAESPPPAAA